MKKSGLLFLFSFLFTNLNGQIIVIQPKDSTYLNIDSVGIWSFKHSLAKGQYWIIQQTICGPDTLGYAEFIANGVKHGTWVEWESRVCIGVYKEGSDEIKYQDFASDRYTKFDETTYDSGYLVTSTSYYTGTSGRDQPLSKFYYPPNTTKLNYWNYSESWSEDGVLLSKTVCDQKGFYEIESFHHNGSPRMKGRTNNSDEHIGTWAFWDEQGELIGKVRFKNGKPKKTIKYQDKELPFWATPEN